MVKVCQINNAHFQTDHLIRDGESTTISCFNKCNVARDKPNKK